MVLETHMNLCITVADFWKKNLLFSKWRKWTKNRVFWIYWKIGRYFFLNSDYNESLNPIFGKNLVPEIWIKVLLANISRPKWWNSLIFCKLIEKYWVGVVKNGHGNLKSDLSQEWFDKLSLLVRLLILLCIFGRLNVWGLL